MRNAARRGTPRKVDLSLTRQLGNRFGQGRGRGQEFESEQIQRGLTFAADLLDATDPGRHSGRMSVEGQVKLVQRPEGHACR